MIMQLSLTFAAVLLLGFVEQSYQMPPTIDNPRMCWTKWYNRDSPDGQGDYETLKDLRREHPKIICLSPDDIEAVTVYGEIPAEQTGQVFYRYDSIEGFVCHNKDQTFGYCMDYKVRFRCPCRFNR